MSKQLSKPGSPFDALKIARIDKDKPAKHLEVQTVEHLDSPGGVVSARGLAKSTNPVFMKFTVYVRKQTHLAVKTRLVSQGREMSDLVEELLSDWLQKQSGIGR